MPFSAVGFYAPCCIAKQGLHLSPGAEKLRRAFARGLVGSCVGDVRWQQQRGCLTVYLCDRHGEQRRARAK